MFTVLSPLNEPSMEGICETVLLLQNAGVMAMAAGDVS